VFSDHFGRNAQFGYLHVIGIGHHAAGKIIGTAGYVGNAVGNKTSRAGFGEGKGLLFSLEGLSYFFFDHESYYSETGKICE